MTSYFQFNQCFTKGKVKNYIVHYDLSMIKIKGCVSTLEVKIKNVIDEYIVNVNKMCNILLQGINLQENLNLNTKYQFFEYRNKTRKTEFYMNDIKFKLHGRGCFVFSKEMFLNWDFGYRSRWCGIDPYKVGMTLKENKSPFIEYYDGEILKQACVQAVIEGEMISKGNLYHYSIPDNETFIPDFPDEYDILLIENFGKKWLVKRNKEIDKFLRKSNRVHNEVHNNLNAYTLRFFLENKEVYSIPYDDVCYPESAIKIMSDNIIWNLKKCES